MVVEHCTEEEIDKAIEILVVNKAEPGESPKAQPLKDI